MGFIRDIRKIVAKVPTKRQTLLFSGSDDAADIRELANASSRHPVNVNVAPAAVAVSNGRSPSTSSRSQKPVMLEHILNANARHDTSAGFSRGLSTVRTGWCDRCGLVSMWKLIHAMYARERAIKSFSLERCWCWSRQTLPPAD